jgi:SAM-dependent methyltransferase
MVSDSPSSFVVEWLPRVANDLPEPRRALDVAMGCGRHAEALAAAGLRPFGVDVNVEAVRHTVDRLRRHGIVLRAWCADLTRYPLPSAAFALVLVTRYLQRDLFTSLGEALQPGGVIMYETFTEAQLRFDRGPRSPHHLLREGELAGRFSAFEVLFSEEVREPEAVARIVARRKPSA